MNTKEKKGFFILKGGEKVWLYQNVKEDCIRHICGYTLNCNKWFITPIQAVEMSIIDLFPSRPLLFWDDYEKKMSFFSVMHKSFF